MLSTSLFTMKQLDDAIDRARDFLLSIQSNEGFWVFDLEADVTISSEYILLQRVLGREMAPQLKKGLGRYLRRKQLQNGGWPLFEGGAADVSASVKAYFALKLVGDPPHAQHMSKARQLILTLGGAAQVNVFTRITLALFGQISWRTVPAMPAEIMFFPRWFIFHLFKVSYWSRTVIVPLLILYAKQPICRLNSREGVPELFREPVHKFCHLDRFVPGNHLKNLFIFLDRMLKQVERCIPRRLREKAIRRAEQWTVDRMQGKGGIGAIFPAMANAVMALKTLGYPEDHLDLIRGINAVDNLLVTRVDEAFCQPCHSPIWDTCLSLSALLEAGLSSGHHAVADAIGWLFEKRICVQGDWAYQAHNLDPFAWAFQFENNFYPDLDDTASVLMAFLRSGVQNTDKHKKSIAKAVNWIVGMQSTDGGWGAFDIDSNSLYLNQIPFADHGALLDPSTPDLTARCIELLATLGYGRDFPPITRGLEFLRREQYANGAWFGRWGVNYIYGTWSVLVALGPLGEDMSRPYIRKAVDWLKSCQNSDNGWGETCYSYNDPALAGKGLSTPSQTAWAVLGLMAAGEVNSAAVQYGINYLCKQQNARGDWHEEFYTGTGFPRVFYLRYHGYSHYFSLWAIGVYRRLTGGGRTLQDEMKLKSPADLDLPEAK